MYCRFQTSQITNGLMFVQLGMGLTLTFKEIGKVGLMLTLVTMYRA